MERPKLELPQRVAPARPIFDRRSAFFFVSALLGLALVVWLQLAPRPFAPTPAAATVGLTADQLEQLALRLEDKNLAAAAAETWEQFLAASGGPPEQAARIHARVGRLLQDAGQYERAIAHYYRAEMLAGANKQAAGEDLATRLRDCFQRLGRYGELAREVQERTSIAAKPGDLAGQQIVAEIGPEKITAAEFDNLLHDELELMIQTGPGLSGVSPEAIRKQVHEQYARPEMRQRMLQQTVMRRVLAREARRRKLDQNEAFKQRLVHEADSLLAAQLTAQVAAERAGPTPQDVERYYQANQARYAVAAKATFARIVCPTEKDARDVVEMLGDGADFAQLAKDRSQDAGTKEAGGRLPDPLLAEGDEVPGVGPYPALHDRLWKLAAGKHLTEPVKLDDGWHVYRLLDKTEARTPPLAEVRERVEADCRQARRDEVLRQFVEEVFREQNVKLHFGGLAASSQPAS